MTGHEPPGARTRQCAGRKPHAGGPRSRWWRRISRHRQFIDRTVFGADFDVRDLPSAAGASDLGGW
jgi:hypothetical protein